jgi:hypothetical protein
MNMAYITDTGSIDDKISSSSASQRQSAKKEPLKFMLLCPMNSGIPDSFKNYCFSKEQYDEMLSKMQRLRGQVYLADGAIKEEELTDGLHCLEIDRLSWNVLGIDDSGNVRACMRYHENHLLDPITNMWIYKSELATLPEWRDLFTAALESQQRRALAGGKRHAEIGGLAIHPDYRHTTLNHQEPEIQRMALATHVIALERGGCIWVSTATKRNKASRVLRRYGRPLRHGNVTFPEFYDPQYRCYMEALSSDSDFMLEKYSAQIEKIAPQVLDATVIFPATRSKSQNKVHIYNSPYYVY